MCVFCAIAFYLRSTAAMSLMEIHDDYDDDGDDSGQR